MPPSIIQIILGLGVGILGYFLLRPKPITVDEHSTQNSRPRTSDSYARRRKVPTNSTELCTICNEVLGFNNVINLTCSHKFHHKCYEACMEYTPNCPVCGT